MERFTLSCIQKYSEIAGPYQDFSHDYWERSKLKLIWKFVDLVDGKVLDLGSGPGRDGAIFNNSGFSSVSLDVTAEMARLCKEKKLDVIRADFSRSTPFADKSFAGVWSYTSLIHLPKAYMRPLLREIRRITKDDSVLGIGIKEGDFEGYKFNKDRSRGYFISYFRKPELINIFKNGGFDCIFSESYQEKPGDEVILNFLFKKI